MVSKAITREVYDYFLGLPMLNHLNATKSLHSDGIYVFFEKEFIDTISYDCQLILMI